MRELKGRNCSPRVAALGVAASRMMMQRYAVKIRSGGRVVTWATSDDIQIVKAELEQLRRQQSRPEDVWIEDRQPTRQGCEDPAGRD